MVVALAVGLRWQQIGQLSLHHFDEGVLVSGAFGVWLHGLWHFPLAQPLQAPPLFPWLVAGTFALTGTKWPIMGIYLSAALGSATVALYFALLRRLYGEQFALVGAGLLAASDLHVAFSRMALTDVPLTFWFVAGAYALARLVGVENAPPSTREGASTDRRIGRQIVWMLAFGLAAGAAWNTKYNGWMLIAIAATAWMISRVRGWLLPEKADASGPGADGDFGRIGLLLAIGAAALLALACFAPWYLHVERTYPGGYGAVTANHWQYVGRIADWPRRALRLAESLTAFRHYGWLTSVLVLAIAAGWYLARGWTADRGRSGRRVTTRVASLVVAVSALVAAVVLGCDALILFVAAAAIGPALAFGRWTEILFAVWAGAFLILTPFYHPYTRLLVPALPATIVLAVWLVGTALGQTRVATRALTDRTPTFGAQANKTARVVLASTSLGACAAALIWQPFGWLPSRGAWDRWSCRQSYRALGDAIWTANVPADAVVLCQGLPAMTLYVEREWAPLEAVPFDLWLPHVEEGRACYLAVDFWGIFGENHQSALRALQHHIECLEPVATVPNDLNLPTLLDYLPAAAVAQHVSQPWPEKTIVDDLGHSVVVPATLDESRADLIVLYRIDRDRLE